MSKIAELRVLLKKARKSKSNKILLTTDFVSGLLQGIDALQQSVGHDSPVRGSESDQNGTDSPITVKMQGGKFTD